MYEVPISLKKIVHLFYTILTLLISGSDAQRVIREIEHSQAFVLKKIGKNQLSERSL